MQIMIYLLGFIVSINCPFETFRYFETPTEGAVVRLQVLKTLGRAALAAAHGLLDLALETLT